MPLASGVLYALTAARSIQGGDSGELAAVGAVGGVAHPPGYPLFILWSRALGWLPAASPTHRVALATAVAAALAVFMVETAARAWGARPISASLAAAMFAFSPLAWRLATVPEVFMLNIALASAIITVAAPARWEHEERRAIFLAFLAGFGIANHHSVVLIAPLGLFAWGAAVRATERRAFAIAASFGAFVLGLFPYAYLVLAAGSECAWGDTSTLHGLLHHFFRVDYGTTQLSASTDAPEPSAQFVLFGSSLIGSGIGATLMLAAGVALKKRRWSWPVFALVASFALAGPIFLARFNLPPRNLMALVVVRFHLLPLAVGTVIGARGIDGIIDALRSRLAARVALGASIAVLLVRATLSGADAVAEHRLTTERYLRNVFTMLPRDSVLLAPDDDLVGGFEYLQGVLGERRDIVVIAPSLLLSEWYGRRTDAKLGFMVEHGRLSRDTGRPTLDATRLTEQLVASGRPVFLTKWYLASLSDQFASYPVGPLIRLPARPSEVPPPALLLQQNEEVYARLTLDETPPIAHTWAGARYLDYARPWNVLARAFEQQGDLVTAKRCQEHAQHFLPIPEP